MVQYNVCTIVFCDIPVFLKFFFFKFLIHIYVYVWQNGFPGKLNLRCACQRFAGECCHDQHLRAGLGCVVALALLNPTESSEAGMGGTRPDTLY